MADPEVKEALKMISLKIHEAMTDQNMTGGLAEQSQHQKKEVSTQLPNAQNLDEVWELVLAKEALDNERSRRVLDLIWFLMDILFPDRAILRLNSWIWLLCLAHLGRFLPLMGTPRP
jgi:hypothetical protein